MATPTVDADETRLADIYANDVRIDETNKQANTKTATNYAKCFNRHFGKMNEGDGSRVLSQGSAFEGVKVVAADEFDFLLTLNYENRQSLIKTIQSTEIPGFWKLRLSEVGNRAWAAKYAMTDNGQSVLSPKKYKEQLQRSINDFTTKFKAGDKKALGGKTAGYFKCFTDVSSVSDASIGNPAAMVQVTTKHGAEISVDHSLALKLKLGEKDAYFIAKKHPNDPDQTLWQRTESKEEMRRIQNIPEQIRVNYRVSKHLLGPVVGNSYVLKTVFLDMNQSTPNRDMETKSKFLTTMVTKLDRAYADKSLPSFFNRNENVLARYPPQYLQDKANEVHSLYNRIHEQGDLSGAIQSLYERAQNEL